MSTDTGPRRFLIATAVSHYPNAPEWDRPGLVEARRRMVELFTAKLGYEHVSDLGANPTQHQLLWELREFCRSPERRPDDIVAVYIAGHGERLGNEDYVLLTSDTDPEDLYDALQPSVLARKILAGTKVRRLLLMLDTCFSGQGGNELLSSMVKLKNDWREKDAGLAVITSAQPNELAQTGAFPELLSEAVTSLATAGYTPELLALDAVVNATRTNPKRPDFQHIGLEIIGLTGEIPPFLPNAKHSPQLSHTDMALQRAAEWDKEDERRDVEFRTRLLRRAMGHSDQNRVGWWFSGRHRALKYITAWLGSLPEDRPALVVTGDPGSGKTAVLGLLTAVSDAEYRRTVPLAGLGLRDSQLPPLGAIGTAVYAQNLTDQQIVRAVAAALRLPPTEAPADLLNHLNARPRPDRPYVVLIDGLDEAVTPSTLCSQVLRPLMELAGAHLRLLLGTRPHLFGPLGLDRRDHIDLDAPHYADPLAVLTYTVRNLLDAHPDSPYMDCDDDRRLDIARAVAAAAGRSFLVARITAGTLAATPELPDPRDPVWRASLPQAAADAMHRDLHQRFGNDAQRIFDLLRPLAYAEGQGLPWEDVWAPLASELSGRQYSNEHIRDLRRDAGAYVVEAIEDGRSVYRLYHEAMAEYLRDGQEAARAHRAFTTTLRKAVPYALDGSPDWARAHPYALRNLATHASAAGLLDILLADVEYLVHADYDTLAPHLLEAEADEARRNAAVFRSCLHVLRHLDPAARRQVLAVGAARFNIPSLVEALNGRASKRAWKPVAATGVQLSSNLRNALTGHTALVQGLACTELDGRLVAVTGSADTTVQVWDLATGQPVGGPMTGHTSSVEGLACTELDGRPIAVTCSRDTTVRVWDLTTGRAVGEALRGHSAAVHAVACTELDGRPVAVSGSWDETLRIWDLTTGQAVGHPIEGAGSVNTLACTTVDGRPVAVTGSTRELCLWDLTTGQRLSRLNDDDHTWYFTVTCAELDGRPVALSGERDGTLAVWDLRGLRLLAETEAHDGWVSSVTCAVLNGRQVAVTGSQDETAKIWDLGTLGQVGSSLTGHAFPLLSVACAELAGQPVVITSAYDTVRVWDLAPRQLFGHPVIGHTQRILALDRAVVNGRPILVSASADDTVRMWDLTTGLHTDEPLTGRGDGLVKCTVKDGRPVAVSQSRNGTVRTWDLTTGQTLAVHLYEEDDYRTLTACVELDGRQVVVMGAGDGSVQVWDLETDQCVHRFAWDPSHSSNFCVLDDRLVVVSSTPTQTLRVQDLATGRIMGSTTRGPTTSEMTFGRTGDRPIAVTCSDDATIQLWDLRECHPLGDPLTGHTRAVWTVQWAELDGRQVALTGSADNTVRIWDLESRTPLDVIHLPGPCRAVALGADGLLACSFGSDIAVFRRQST
ncbi:caspase family protein [Streptomyces griseus]|uniref:caspase family protein n=1 Tax=Streptomyces griseus TaxID=1911 RepID=UPI00068C1E7B|nr:caspase family protein [Streptomyces griseus]